MKKQLSFMALLTCASVCAYAAPEDILNSEHYRAVQQRVERKNAQKRAQQQQKQQTAGQEQPQNTDTAKPIESSESSGSEASTMMVSVSGFYAYALNSIIHNSSHENVYGSDVGKVHLGGAKLAFDWTVLQGNTEKEPSIALLLEFAGAAGEGKEDYTYYSYSYSSGDYSESEWAGGKRKLELMNFYGAVGTRLRAPITKDLALTANIKIGLDYEHAKYTDKMEDGWRSGNYGNTHNYKYKGDDDAFGLLYGVGVGAEYAISEHWGIVAGVDCIGSTAKPKIKAEYKWDDGDKERYDANCHSTVYMVFSLGVTCRF